MLGHGLSFVHTGSATRALPCVQIGKMVYRSEQSKRKNYGNQQR
ncbi:hypothetical protein COLINT_02172 [Collinsella intestinalis DSM 13280]|uniref:Uncharacterized protein n=1 Tax=Collinsella intestinalis DSM 13280 TaxID=521003 RepID=C4F805_9ACTN|nr:hypothetical protein COLINT_02172 [Collinsella intestinalis DSM 13280]